MTHENRARIIIRETNGTRIDVKNQDMFSIIQILQLPYLKTKELIILCPGSEIQQVRNLITEISSLINAKKLDKLRTKQFYWRCVPDEADEFIEFLKLLNENELEMIHNDMNNFSSDQMKEVGGMKQWMNAKEIWLGNGEVSSVDQFLHVHNCNVYFSKLEVEDIWKMILSFQSRDLPIGSSFDLFTENPPKLDDVFKMYKVVPNHQPIIPDDIGIIGRHTQRFKTGSDDKMLVVRNTELGIRGNVLKKD
ncbi:hypothetical protein GCK72_019535 [Caenorhabditis remanei]|uniref:DUF38 domain-containing protein n=1 Tax=Caenorhabditis remanei TaxID=31234 RepID=A0A6A5GD45_CAERE|nr:hypothetical protein GCK72_019535 [Caenorhabditis remanei]KAF1752980.1 hypothetical protein GCK72_019535 [Caenorhabditis remanei]